MNYKKIGSKYVIRIDQGEEIVETLTQFCTKMGIKLGSITGIGATDKATIGLYDVQTKQYSSKDLVGDHEIAPLYGNISTMNKKVYLHIHVNLCNNEYKAFGGHLNMAVVSATFEGIIDVIDGEINREFDESLGLNLLKP